MLLLLLNHKAGFGPGFGIAQRLVQVHNARNVVGAEAKADLASVVFV